MSWKDDTTGVFQSSIFGLLIFLIHIDQLSEGLKFNPKPLADISLYSAVKDINLSQNELNENLVKINNWVHQWKMSFNLDPSKKFQNAIFSRKSTNYYIWR